MQAKEVKIYLIVSQRAASLCQFELTGNKFASQRPNVLRTFELAIC